MKATRAIYPQSSNIEISKNKIIICGTNPKTAPTPPIIPSTINPMSQSAVSILSKKDATYFQALIESLLSKNYPKAVECLTHLGFLLPEAEPRTMERLLAELLSLQPAQLKEMDLIALKLEMNDMIQQLPIQVPTRFVFLGRSFITMEGILRSLVSEEDLTNVIKPVFMNWLSKCK